MNGPAPIGFSSPVRPLVTAPFVGPQQGIFVHLPVPSLHTLAPVSLDTFYYEGEMARYTGLPSLSAKAIKAVGMDVLDHCRRLSCSYLAEGALKAGIYEKFPDIDRPSAMRVADSRSLMRLASCVFQVAYANYVSLTWMLDIFPHRYCGEASLRLLSALILHGFHNATYLYNEPYDHAYVGLPFVTERTGEKGVVVVDPTSDQLWHQEPRPRNLLFVTNGPVWEYVTPWGYAPGKDLYPTWAMKKHWQTTPIARFLDQAFRNARPVEGL